MFGVIIQLSTLPDQVLPGPESRQGDQWQGDKIRTWTLHNIYKRYQQQTRDDISTYDRIDALVVNFPSAVRRAIMYSDPVLKATNAALSEAATATQYAEEVLWTPADTQPDASAVQHARMETQRRISEATIRIANGSMETMRLQSFVAGNSIQWKALGLIPSNTKFIANNDENHQRLAVKIDGAVRANTALYQMWTKMVLDLWTHNANGGVAIAPSEDMIKVAARWAAAIDDASLTAEKLLGMASATSMHQGQLVAFRKHLTEISEDSVNLSLYNTTLATGALGLCDAMRESIDRFVKLNAGNPVISKWCAGCIADAVRSDEGTNAAVLMLAELFAIPENSYLTALETVENQYGIQSAAKASYVLNAALSYDHYVYGISADQASDDSLGSIFNNEKRGDMLNGHDFYWSKLILKAGIDKGAAKDLYEFASIIPYGGALGMLNTLLSDDDVAKAQLWQDIEDRDKMSKYVRATVKFVIDSSKTMFSDDMRLADMVKGKKPSLEQFLEAEKWVQPLITGTDHVTFWGLSSLNAHVKNATVVIRYALHQKRHRQN